jgi:FdhD protein
MIVASSCGLCGVRTIEKTLQESVPVDFGLSLSHELLLQMPDRLSEAQRIYPTTRAAHAAGIFSNEGELVAFAEDIGRHNALDKAIGKCILNGLSTRGLGVVISSRASFEMISKAVRAGIEIVLASAAASALAIRAAHQWNMTLCSPVRSDYALIHTHPQRITENGKPISTQSNQR